VRDGPKQGSSTQPTIAPLKLKAAVLVLLEEEKIVKWASG